MRLVDASPSPAEGREPKKKGKSEQGEETENEKNGSEVDIHPVGSTDAYYSLLGVAHDATPTEIRRAYYALCKKLHPDKVSADGGQQLAEELQKVQEAYSVLSDEVKRLMLDLKSRRFSEKETQRKLAELQELQRRRTNNAKQNMELEYAEKLQKERAANGVVVVSALYGNLRLRPSFREEGHSLGVIKEQHLEGPYVDVTIPLQCQIDASRFVFAGGASSSFEQIRGFYDPAVMMKGGESALYVLYRFRGQLHEVTVSDGSRFALPLRSHLCLKGTPRGPYAASNVASTSAQMAIPQRPDSGRSFCVCTLIATGVACSAFWVYFPCRQHLQQLMRQLGELQEPFATAAAAVSSLGAALSRAVPTNTLMLLRSSASNSSS